jgi:hypothetical protein
MNLKILDEKTKVTNWNGKNAKISNTDNYNFKEIRIFGSKQQK